MATYCEACYENAVCLGGDSTYPIPGYVRMHQSTDLIIRCFNREACSGVPKEDFPKEVTDETRHMTLQNCNEGYQGIMCATCSDGYWKNPITYNCYECSEKD